MLSDFVVGRKRLPVTAIAGRVSEASSSAFDSSLDVVGVGGSPWRGDLARPGVYVPSAATVDQGHRYFVRLAGIFVPAGCFILVKGLRQHATIRFVATQAHSAGVDPTVVDLVARERPITDPFWIWPDGANVSWHLRWLGCTRFPKASDPAQLPGTSPDMNGLDTALLYTPPLFPYRPPGGGVPPGQPVGDWGSFGDIRFPWNSNDFQFGEYLEGPGKLVFYASVHQTCAADRQNPTDLPGLDEEDVFVSQFPTSAVYGRVAGSIVFEAGECGPCSALIAS